MSPATRTTADSVLPAASSTAVPDTTATGSTVVKQTESCVEYAAPFDAWEAAGYSGTVAISTGGEPVCLAAYGTADARTPNTIDTVYSVGSVTKAFTAAAIFALVDDASLSLKDGPATSSLASPAPQPGPPWSSSSPTPAG
jgi:CubicO group peptidase (beta-lactamase class C family)